jgi:hypothetical protein
MFIMIGSTIIAATCPLFSRKQVSSASRSFIVHGIVAAAVPAGIPPEAGTRVLERRLVADERGVVDAVVGALHLDHSLAPGEAARDAQRVHRGLGAAVGVAQELEHREARLQLGGELLLELVRHPVHGALLDLRGHRLEDDRVRVARHHHAEAHVVVEVLVAVEVPQPRAARLAHVDRVRRVEAEVRGHAEREVLLAPLELSARLRGARGETVHLDLGGLHVELLGSCGCHRRMKGR